MKLNAPVWDELFITGDFQAQTKLFHLLLEMMKRMIQVSDREPDSSTFKGFSTLRGPVSMTNPRGTAFPSHTHTYE